MQRSAKAEHELSFVRCAGHLQEHWFLPVVLTDEAREKSARARQNARDRTRATGLDTTFLQSRTSGNICLGHMLQLRLIARREASE